jgi:LysR family nitrogen assimilation transcriptional regulator
MQLHQLRYFVHVAELGSFSRAATCLNVTQPALSRQVNLLEKELGVRLLHRDGRGVSLTASGSTLFDHAVDLLDRVRHARQAVAAAGAAIGGDVRIGLPSWLAQVLMPGALLRSRADNPDLAIATMETTDATVLEEWLLAGRIDMALIDAPRQAGSHIRTTALLRHRLCLVGKAGAQRGRAEHGGFAAVAALPLILPAAPHPVREAMEAAALACGARLNIAWTTDSEAVAKELLLRDAGCAILPRQVVAAELGAGLFWARELSAPRIERQWVVATARERPLDRGGQAVQAALLAEAQAFDPPAVLPQAPAVEPRAAARFPAFGTVSQRRLAVAQPAL